MKKIRAYKDKQFLVFEFNDGKNVKYNLATFKTIGKQGKPVKDVRSQLQGYNIPEIIDMFEDEKYKDFLKFVHSRINPNAMSWKKTIKVKNVGTFLTKIKYYSIYEQYFTSGITNFRYPIHCPFSSIPKGLIKLYKKYKYIKISDDLITVYKKYPNEVLNMFETNYLTLNKEELSNLLSSEYGMYYLFELINTYKYKTTSLMIYIDSLMTYEALCNLNTIVRELYDYAKMMSGISNKYEKYPKNFLTTHKIASRNYMRLKKEFSEDIFKQRIDKSLEYSYGDYKLIYPNCTQDIKDEAVQMGNCVASYVDDVINGVCHILFLRKKDNPKQSLVTIEIRNKKIVQAKQKYNYDVTAEQQEFIDKYNSLS